MLKKSYKSISIIILLIIIISGCELDTGFRSSRGPDSEGECDVKSFVYFLMDNPDASEEEINHAARRYNCEKLITGTYYDRTDPLILQNNCPNLGDVSGDGLWNVLDIVQLANCVLAQNCSTIENGCAGDLNGDGSYNVLDIVTLANCVLAQNCGG